MRYVIRTRRSRAYRRDVWMKMKDREQMKRWRVRKGLTQGELAFLAGCTQQTISLLETGKMTTLTEDLAIAIAKRLGNDWEDLFVACEAAVVPEVKSDVNSNLRGLVSA